MEMAKEFDSAKVESVSDRLGGVETIGGTVTLIDGTNTWKRLSYTGFGADNETLDHIFDLCNYDLSTLVTKVIVLTPKDRYKKTIHITLKDSESCTHFLKNLEAEAVNMRRRSGMPQEPKHAHRRQVITVHESTFKEEPIVEAVLRGIQLGGVHVRNKDLSPIDDVSNVIDESDGAVAYPLVSDDEKSTTTSSSSSSDSDADKIGKLRKSKVEDKPEYSNTWL